MKELNTKYQQAVDELKTKLNVTEMELCKERERVSFYQYASFMINNNYLDKCTGAPS